ncbi:DUF2066 domain-containing protein [Undibacter mobilis]|uniref:DUF2066 domain-containing protein n=1 Tax=Undibacter mobilis TaxID=2292256 RepID=A0A371B8D7_9BRAD|nr:DUF2066 domain-containing protein [Undibacter mobilis]RDV03787.1 DUF2066 domain-containing protein [Undibacter mobilis]
MNKPLFFVVLTLAIEAAIATAFAAETKPPPPIPLEDIYTTQAVVTGKDERNRPLGFQLCFEDVLVKASGDATILGADEVAAMAAKAGNYIDSFSYFDRLSGRAIHDEQGSYDRPHFLTCHFNPAKIDNVLASLGRKTWKGKRPALTMIVTVNGRKRDGVLAADGDFDPDMRESLDNAARRYGMKVVLPASEPLRAAGLSPKTPTNTIRAKAERLTPLAGGEVSLIGDLTWSDKATGWIATWHIDAQDRAFTWSARGINYDEAFRVAIRGAMRALSGNGAPVSELPR